MNFSVRAIEKVSDACHRKGIGLLRNKLERIEVSLRITDLKTPLCVPIYEQYLNIFNVEPYSNRRTE